MNYLTIILLLIIIGCKNQTKTETETKNGIDKTVYEMWGDFTESNPEFKKEELPDSNPFHNNEYDANRLAELILIGEKKAGSNLYYWYEEANADLPKIGTKSIVTDFDGKAKAIIEIIKVDTIPFNEISREYAELDMGTKNGPLKKWRKAHWDFFTQALEGSQKQPTEDMLIVCEWFETIWPEKR
ncbi:ASCH domain-containing protein [Pricia sp.]|uniref:ASCH domain-containing protein n=1 Tax=Pricia sp. TaxID=2268138 RepID=UPI0035940D9B